MTSTAVLARFRKMLGFFEFIGEVLLGSVVRIVRRLWINVAINLSLFRTLKDFVFSIPFTLWLIFHPKKSLQTTIRPLVRQTVWPTVRAALILFPLAFFAGFALQRISLSFGTQLTAALRSSIFPLLIRDVVPLTVAVVVIGRTGGAITTSLTIKKTNGVIRENNYESHQLMHFIVMPRVAGTAISSFILTLLSSFILLVGYVSVWSLMDRITGGGRVSMDIGMVSLEDALYRGLDMVGSRSLFYGALKGGVFGAVVGFISCSFALNAPLEDGETDLVYYVVSQAVLTSTLVCVAIEVAVVWLRVVT